MHHQRAAHQRIKEERRQEASQGGSLPGFRDLPLLRRLEVLFMADDDVKLDRGAPQPLLRFIAITLDPTYLRARI